MITVLDASAAIEIALNKEKAIRFKEYLKESDVVIVPNTFPSEIVNSFWKYRTIAKVDTEKCENGIKYCIDLVDDFIDTKDLCFEVYNEAVQKKHPAYDLFYLILARRNNASILTNDKKMKKIANELGINVYK